MLGNQSPIPAEKLSTEMHWADQTGFLFEKDLVLGKWIWQSQFYSLCEPAQHRINLWLRSQLCSSLFNLHSVKRDNHSQAESWSNPFPPPAFHFCFPIDCPLNQTGSTICRPGRSKIIPPRFFERWWISWPHSQAACKQLDHPSKGWCGVGVTGQEAWGASASTYTDTAFWLTAFVSAAMAFSTSSYHGTLL